MASYHVTVFDRLARCDLATLPTPLERGPVLDGGGRLWVKRDDLTGLGGGGNKARKLEFLCGEAVAGGARSLVTVGAGQSNHCRMTAAAGARLGLEVHLVLSGDAEDGAGTGNQLLSRLFGAQLHFTGSDAAHWGELEIAREALTGELTAAGMAPASTPIGGSTAVGAIGYAVAMVELAEQCEAAQIEPSTIVFTSSRGGTHAGLLAGRALLAARGRPAPDVVAIGVAKGVNLGHPDIVSLANDALGLIDAAAGEVTADDVEIDTRWIGDDYAAPTAAADEAIAWAATRGGWLMDRTYSGKGFSGLLGLDREHRFVDRDVVFLHTGGWPALFAAGGVPADPAQ
ncbi:MAG: pyridoxal-phosphate dependent enzyme [Acidimicrobiia bacterium]|nr:pyridoxal-phosphate dependent enzyme [Acidimicrobiia bacterium]